MTAISAGAAGSLAAVITTPIDVIKTRIMLSASDTSSAAPSQTPHSTPQTPRAALEQAQRAAARRGRGGAVAVGKEILRAEGARGLFRGGGLRGLWTAAGSGLYLGTYESGRRYLEERRVGFGEGNKIS